jgi:hypothetical protein
MRTNKRGVKALPRRVPRPYWTLMRSTIRQAAIASFVLVIALVLFADFVLFIRWRR